MFTALANQSWRVSARFTSYGADRAKWVSNLEPSTPKCFLLVMCLFLASLYSRMEEWKKHRSTNWLKVSLLRGGAGSWLSLGYCQTQQLSPRTMQGSSSTFPKPAIPICLCCLLRFFWPVSLFFNSGHYLLAHISFICCIFSMSSCSAPCLTDIIVSYHILLNKET